MLINIPESKDCLKIMPFQDNKVIAGVGGGRGGRLLNLLNAYFKKKRRQYRMVK
jgi:hypothetical protein